MESTASSDTNTKGDSTASRLIGERFDAGAFWLERHPLVILAALATVYLLRLPAPLQKILWYDELHTYYIAQAPTIARFIELNSHTDLNPPLIYALARLSFNLFGVTPLAVRLPSILAFFLGSMAVFVFLSRRVGRLWAAAAIAFFWYSPYFYYATEARPYGILLGSFSLTLLSWDTLSSRTHRGWGLAGIAIGNTGMMLTHVLAPLSIMPFCVAELFRSLKQRKLDLAAWAALLLPLACGLLSLSFVHRVGGVIYPPVFKASFGKVGLFFFHALFPVLPGLLLITPVSLLIAGRYRRTSSATPILTAYELPLLIASLLTPLLANVALMSKNGPFWDRYCTTAALVLYVWIGFFLARRCRMNRVAGMFVVLILIAISLNREMPALTLVFHPAPAAETRIDQVKPELPFVVGSVLTFLEMDHEESTAFLSRVYYVTDRSSALRYAQTDVAEGITGLDQYFPSRVNIEPYKDFAAKHQRFLVFGTIDRPEDWLLRKLIAEGARVTKIAELRTPYRDSIVYDVTLAGQSNSNRD